MVYAEASFPNNSDDSTQIGYIVPVGDASDRAIVVHCCSSKIKRDVHSVMGGALYVMENAFDNAYMFRVDHASTFNRLLLILLLTDYFPLYNLLLRHSWVATEKRLVIYISTIRQACEQEDIWDLVSLEGR